MLTHEPDDTNRHGSTHPERSLETTRIGTCLVCRQPLIETVVIVPRAPMRFEVGRRITCGCVREQQPGGMP